MHNEHAPDHRREEPATREDRDLMTRSLTLRADSVDETSRSVEAVIASETPVAVYDWYSGGVIEEVLRMDGAELPEQVPLLANHASYSIDFVYGSVRTIGIAGAEAIARLYFAEGMEDPENAWLKVKQRHLRDVSAGYRPTEYTDIEPGQTAIVGGRSYTAGQRRLRVTTRWQLREVSLVPIGADQRSKIRAAQHTGKESAAMNEKLRKYLETIGLRADANDVEANAFYSKLGTVERAAADAAAAAVTPAAPPANPPAPPAVEGPDAIRAAATAAATAAERTRVRSIQELAGEDVPAETVTRAISEGWDEARASREFLQAVRSTRGAAGTPERAPFGITRSHEADCTARALGMALMHRSGLDPIRSTFDFVDGTYRPNPNREQDPALLRAADAAWQYRDMSLVDICREALRMDGQRVPHARGEMIRSAVSGSTLSAIFTTSVNAQLMQSYTDAGDSTVGWCSETDVANFQTQERAQMGKVGGLTKHARGKNARHLDTSDSKEEYKIARYTGQFVVDEMDILDDRFGAIAQETPADIGLSARQLRPNLVYALLLANAALGADSVALFHSTHSNTTSGALAAGTLQTAIQLLAKQRLRNRVLNLRARFLVVPQDLWFTGNVLLTSAERYNNSENGSKNPLAEMGITLRADDRIGVAGVTDPNSGTSYTGTATNYFLTARPGEEGAKTIEVGYLRGTGRAPQIRPFILTQGAWGLGWDCSMDIGTKALDYRGMAYSTGA